MLSAGLSGDETIGFERTSIKFLWRNDRLGTRAGFFDSAFPST